MNNTIPNVPRKLLERVLNAGWGSETVNALDDLRDFLESASSSANHVEDVRAMVAAPSPAGVDGLNTDRNAAFKACPESGCDWGSFYLGWKARGEVEQAIIDGLRAEIGAQRVKTCIALKERNDAREERDQQAQRIGELEGLLRDCYPGCGLTARQTQSIRERIDAALAAGKEGE